MFLYLGKQMSKHPTASSGLRWAKVLSSISNNLDERNSFCNNPHCSEPWSFLGWGLVCMRQLACVRLITIQHSALYYSRPFVFVSVFVSVFVYVFVYVFVSVFVFHLLCAWDSWPVWDSSLLTTLLSNSTGLFCCCTVLYYSVLQCTTVQYNVQCCSLNCYTPPSAPHCTGQRERLIASMSRAFKCVG